MSLIITEVSPQQLRELPMFVCQLSNGLTAYQVDDHPDLESNNSWQCLKKYCKEENVHVERMSLRFRDHTEEIGAGADGYFFVHSLLANITGYTQYFYNVGAWEMGQPYIKVDRYIIPEIIPLDSELRLVDDDTVRRCLISRI